jgi:hypothetical protein
VNKNRPVATGHLIWANICYIFLFRHEVRG